ncbi:hypothetical protein A7U60_g5452 [Sanghuangporus baumii]|uniref:GATA-type domain-containing protein n=1 Tax=Sanghuangporus baumii TaxID=108892 RepID=A0A9Q5HXI2_SANBA|nr:hypothetical protein A7U60_g5452 [Sanghuangporus baumii]
MASTHFDAVTVSSDSSLPQTPSPRNSIVLDHPFENVKPQVDFDQQIEPNSIFAADSYPHHYPESEPITHSMENPAMWNGAHAAPFYAPQRQGSNGSLLQELHGQDYAEQLDAYSPPPLTSSSEWSTPAPLPHPVLPPHQLHQEHIQAQAMSRRASFSSMHSDHDDGMHRVLPPFMPEEQNGHYNPYGPRDTFYSEPLHMNDNGSPQPTLSADPSALHGHMQFGTPPHLEDAYMSPHAPYRDMDEGIKLEDGTQVIVPSQHIFYPRPPSQAGHLPPMPLYMAPHAAIPIQHTDDAASKETQYLRRRCFNCHTTEPPSWRRSTLNPGKIVCNKCGLYERTHLRPRPQRFDELRAGNKSRKHSSKVLSGSTSPKERSNAVVKKEQNDMELEAPSRRRSASNSSTHSASSDLDDSVSIYSSASAGSISGADSYNNSPLMASFSIPNSSSVPTASPTSSPQALTLELGAIRLPTASLNDVASLPSGPHQPRKAATAPYFNSNSRAISPAGSIEGSDYMAVRRGSMPIELSHRSSPLLTNGSTLGLPEVTGWQPISIEEADVKLPLSRSSSRASMAA